VVALYRKGIVSKADLDGLEPEEQDYKTNMQLLEMVTYRKGIGAVLAEGLAGAARIIGNGAEDYAYHIKGQALVYDPRAKGIFGTMEFTQLTNPRGAHVAFGGGPAYQAGRPLGDFLKHGERMGMPSEAYARVFDQASFNVGRLSRYSEDWASLFDCLGLCNRAFVNRFYHVQTISELYAALSGNDVSPAELMTVAERCWNLWRVLNARSGFTREDDRPPKIWFTPLVGEGKTYPLVDYFQTTTYAEKDLEKYLDDYYDERGWDKETGVPAPKKLKELGLEEELAPAI
jgi:aldehyde:ferredoxin oxidoreductase